MSLYNNKEIEDMNFEELRVEVSSMRSELTKYKRLLDLFTEDMENSALGKNLTMENGKLRTQIKAVAGEISTKVEQIEETADSVSAMKSSIEQTAGGIKTSVEQIEETADSVSKMQTSINQTAKDISLQATEVTRAENSVIDKEAYIKVTAENIEKIVNDSAGNISKIEQNVQGLRSYVAKATRLSEAEEVSSTEERTDTDAIYVIRKKDDADYVLSETYYYYDIATEDWETLSGETIFTVFEQTPTGFNLKGNVQIDGSCIMTGSLKFDSSDRPLEVQYSTDGVTEDSWHDTFDSSNDKFMRIKIGAQWSDAMKVVGSDGEQGVPGEPGNNATVTAQAMFDALTEEGNLQGIFPVFVKGEDGEGKTQIYINAEMINGKLISGLRVQSPDCVNNTIACLDKGYFYLYPNEDTDGSKFSIGMYKMADTYCPYIVFGEGSGSATKPIEDHPIIYGTMLMEKDVNGFNMAFTPTDESANRQGIWFFDSTYDGIPRIAFFQNTRVDFGHTVLDFENASITGLKVTFG